MASVYDEIEIEDMDWQPAERTFFYACPCGDKFFISLVRIVSWSHSPAPPWPLRGSGRGLGCEGAACDRLVSPHPPPSRESPGVRRESTCLHSHTLCSSDTRAAARRTT